MKFALLGADPDALALARATAQSDQHSLVWACDLGPAADLVRSWAPRIVLARAWEDLLAASPAEAVIVARGADLDARADQLRRLVQAGMPLLVSHPAHDSLLIYYELEMIRRETGSVALPYLPARWHPAIAGLKRLMAEPAAGHLGQVEQLQLERTLAGRGKAEVLAWFARDADLLAALCGELNKVGAMGPQAGADSYANLGVQLFGPTGVLVRWSVGPVVESAEGRLLLVGANGKALLRMPADGSPWTLETQPGRNSDSPDTNNAQTWPDWDPASAALDNLSHVIAGGVVPDRTVSLGPVPDEPNRTVSLGPEPDEPNRTVSLGPEPDEPNRTVSPSWTDAARTLDLADAVQRSLARGRTVDVHFDDYTEQATFKGTMTSLGCGLIIAGLVSSVIAAILAKTKVLPLAGYWLYVLLAVFAIFLLLQLLQLVFAGENEKKAKDAD